MCHCFSKNQLQNNEHKIHFLQDITLIYDLLKENNREIFCQLFTFQASNEPNDELNGLKTWSKLKWLNTRCIFSFTYFSQFSFWHLANCKDLITLKFWKSIWMNGRTYYLSLHTKMWVNQTLSKGNL